MSPPVPPPSRACREGIFLWPLGICTPTGFLHVHCTGGVRMEGELHVSMWWTLCPWIRGPGAFFIWLRNRLELKHIQ